MAGSVNRAIIIGNLGADPETRTFQNGGKVVNLSVATSETWKSKDGERREKTEWHRVSIFAEGPASFAEQYLRKGAKVYIEGQIETNKYQDRSGQDRYSTQIVVRPYGGQLVGLSSSGDGGGGQAGGAGGGQRSGPPDDRDRNPSGGYDQSPEGHGQGDLDDFEIPF